jgi:hypothetical protein
VSSRGGGVRVNLPPGRGRGSPVRPQPGSASLARREQDREPAGGARAGLLSRRGPGLVLAVLLSVVAVAQVVAYPGRFDRDPPMLGPQENLRFELAQQWVRDGRPSRELDVPAGVPADVVPALTPRDAALQEGQVVPKDFPYAIGLTALLVSVDRRLALASSALAGLALLAVAAALARRQGGPWSGVVAAAVLASAAAFTAGTSGPVNTGAAVALSVVGGVLLLLPTAATPTTTGAGVHLSTSRARDVICGLSFGIGVHLHHDVVLLAAGLVVPFVLPSQGGLPRALRIGCGASVALLPGFAYYAWLYGSPLTTGYAVGAEALGTSHDDFFSLFTLNTGLLWQHLGHYAVRFEVGLLLAGALVSVAYARRRGTRRLATGLLLGGIPYLVFMGARPLYGVDGFTAGASFLRYSLPVVALLVCLCAASTGIGPPPHRHAVAAALGVTALLGVVVQVQSPGGLVDVHRQVVTNTAIRDAVLQATEPGAVVVTARWDKLVWPHRRTITAAYLVRDPTEGLRYGSSMYDVVPTPGRLAEVVADLAHGGVRVYVLYDSLPPYVGGLDLELRLAGVRRDPTAVPSLSLITAVSRSRS